MIYLSSSLIDQSNNKVCTFLCFVDKICHFWENFCKTCSYFCCCIRNLHSFSSSPYYTSRNSRLCNVCESIRSIISNRILILTEIRP
nr:MAG TPA: hypothetical protein [Caudoviricetes sp.]